MKHLLFVAAICLLCNSSCTMDGADNPGNSAESPANSGPETGSTNEGAYSPEGNTDMDTTAADTTTHTP